MAAAPGRKNGRPSRPEVRAKTDAFLALLANGESLLEATKRADLSPWRLLCLLDDPDTYALIGRLLAASRGGALGRAA